MLCSCDVRQRYGTVDSTGAFAEIEKDLGNKPNTFASYSIDPRHSATDIYWTGPYNTPAPISSATAGLINNLPAMIPVSMVYGQRL